MFALHQEHVYLHRISETHILDKNVEKDIQLSFRNLYWKLSG
jgi:hypothetical protein